MAQLNMFVATLGDPFSINVAAMLALRSRMEATDFPKILIGSKSQWDDQTKRLGASWKLEAFDGQLSRLKSGHCYFWNIDGDQFAPAEQLTALERGRIANDALEALKRVDAPKRLAVLTAPIDKAACAAAGFPFHGQTEFFEQLWGTGGIMVLAGPRLRVGLATNHIALHEVSTVLSAKRIEDKLRALVMTLRNLLGVEAPRIGVCGLNPHCSDNGLFGWEDAGVIAPAVVRARERLTPAVIRGPFPADTLFHRAMNGEFDAVLAMYHDQGLGPLKTVHFYDAVNITGGLRHLRVSPDHGPARDLFMSNAARFDSFEWAWDYCQRYLGQP